MNLSTHCAYAEKIMSEYVRPGVRAPQLFSAAPTGAEAQQFSILHDLDPAAARLQTTPSSAPRLGVGLGVLASAAVVAALAWGGYRLGGGVEDEAARAPRNRVEVVSPDLGRPAETGASSELGGAAAITFSSPTPTESPRAALAAARGEGPRQGGVEDVEAVAGRAIPPSTPEPAPQAVRVEPVPRTPQATSQRAGSGNTRTQTVKAKPRAEKATPRAQKATPRAEKAVPTEGASGTEADVDILTAIIRTSEQR